MRAHYKILLVLCIAAFSFAFLPWHSMIESRLEAALESRGFQNVHLTLSDINLRGATLQADSLQFNKGDLKASAAKADIHTRNRAGDWRLQDLRVEAGSVELPSMAGAGKLEFGGRAFLLSGQIKGKDSAYRADFNIDYPFARTQDAKLVLAYAAMPWKGGTLTTKNVTIPLTSKQPVKLALQIQRVSTDALLQTLTGKRVSATGTVSGSLPLEVGRDGSVSFGAGALQADSAGTMTIPPDAIPGDNKQVDMVREVLKNFHYKGLSISVKNDKEGGITLLIALEGNNPDMYNGRPVKLNVRLVGDVLDYIRQNVLFLTSPETMLKQDQK